MMNFLKPDYHKIYSDTKTVKALSSVATLKKICRTTLYYLMVTITYQLNNTFVCDPCHTP